MGILISAALYFLSYVSRIAVVGDKREIKINNRVIIAEIAATAALRGRGLSGRDRLGSKEGMLFIFDEPSRYSFWMKDMKFPIDIIWIRQNLIVGIEENIPPPLSQEVSELKVYEPPLPVTQVLEVAAGRARILRAKVGDTVYVR